MRRSDYQYSADDKVLSELFDESVGYLGIMDSMEFPRTVPIHFLERNGKIYFHGALDGEKFDAYQNGRNVSFTVIKSLAMIPSYWRTKEYACPATTYYLSAYGRSTGKIIEDVEAKADILQKLMEKYQPEGGYLPIQAGLEMYVKPMEETGVFELEITEWDVKCKVGQNQNNSALEKIKTHLQERGTVTDLLTISWMQFFQDQSASSIR
ncbi:MAG: pyridoxamine 5'-phosphate oxidase family protein [Candidatus Marinimicrobia bacterium]|nr:pyridoxamine 5'-phosphate oxidase family protein [Candidatus Neomarinimicrobiota bacterium]